LGNQKERGEKTKHKICAPNAVRHPTQYTKFVLGWTHSIDDRLPKCKASLGVEIDKKPGVSGGGNFVLLARHKTEAFSFAVAAFFTKVEMKVKQVEKNHLT
jgi:hypothetical protein